MSIHFFSGRERGNVTQFRNWRERSFCSCWHLSPIIPLPPFFELQLLPILMRQCFAEAGDRKEAVRVPSNNTSGGDTEDLIQVFPNFWDSIVTAMWHVRLNPWHSGVSGVWQLWSGTMVRLDCWRPYFGVFCWDVLPDHVRGVVCVLHQYTCWRRYLSVDGRTALFWAQAICTVEIRHGSNNISNLSCKNALSPESWSYASVELDRWPIWSMSTFRFHGGWFITSDPAHLFSCGSLHLVFTSLVFFFFCYTVGGLSFESSQG
jgi:hypothetical protein